MRDGHMWSYWRDKHGRISAIKDDYPELLRDFKMQVYLANYEGTVSAIEVRVEELLAEAAEDRGALP